MIWDYVENIKENEERKPKKYYDHSISKNSLLMEVYKDNVNNDYQTTQSISLSI